MARHGTQAKVVRVRTAVARQACSFYTLSKRSLEQLRAEYPTLNRCMLRIEEGLVTDFDSELSSPDGEGGGSPRSSFAGGGWGADDGYGGGDGGGGGGASSRRLEARMRIVEKQVAELQA
eukprot:COSAG06_NODE_3484_length_5277_cov_2.093666_1_plen_119_part_10